MKTNKVLIKLSAIIFVLTVFLINVSSGPPPGVSGGTAVQTKTTASSIENKTRFSLNIGLYKPSLSMINEDLKYYGLDPIGSSSIYTIGISGGKDPIILNFSYWVGSSKSSYFKETINMYIFDVGGSLWNIAKLFPKEYSDYFNLNWNFVARDIFATLKDEYLNSGTYKFYTAFNLDLGTGFELEVFPFKNYKNFSVSLGVDFIFLSLPFLSFEVWESNIPGVEYGDKYKNHEGKDMILETNGNILKFGLNFYF